MLEGSVGIMTAGGGGRGGCFFFVFVCLFRNGCSYVSYGGSSEWAYRGVIDGPRAFFLSVVSDARLFTMNI